VLRHLQGAVDTGLVSPAAAVGSIVVTASARILSSHCFNHAGRFCWLFERSALGHPLLLECLRRGLVGRLSEASALGLKSGVS
jgi:hypothetical protein